MVSSVWPHFWPLRRIVLFWSILLYNKVGNRSDPLPPTLPSPNFWDKIPKLAEKNWWLPLLAPFKASFFRKKTCTLGCVLSARMGGKKERSGSRSSSSLMLWCRTCKPCKQTNPTIIKEDLQVDVWPGRFLEQNLQVLSLDAQGL